MMKMQFEAFDGGNILWGEDNNVRIRATVKVPAGASEDYGYKSLKNAVIDKVASYADSIQFPYDNQEQYISDDAKEGTPDIDIDPADGFMLFEDYGLLEWIDPEEYYAGPWTLYDRATGHDGEQYDIILRTDKTSLRYGTI